MNLSGDLQYFSESDLILLLKGWLIGRFVEDLSDLSSVRVVNAKVEMGPGRATLSGEKLNCISNVSRSIGKYRDVPKAESNVTFKMNLIVPWSIPVK